MGQRLRGYTSLSIPPVQASPRQDTGRVVGLLMAVPADINGPTGRLRPTAFKPGQSGNPFGRRPGTRNRRTVEAREVAQRLVDDPDYREELLQRMIDGTAGAMEPLLWHYAKGKPGINDDGGRGPFALLSTQELRTRLLRATGMPCCEDER